MKIGWPWRRPPQKVLVVGDWIFDEHWVTGTHRSVTSSRVGHEYLHALHAHANALYGLCGAAGTASVIRHAALDGSNPFLVLGAGTWHHDDTAALWRMLNLPSEGNAADAAWKYQSPYRITREFGRVQEPLLLNFADTIVESIREDMIKKVGCGTLRVIRVYRYTGSKLKLLNRIDWEPQMPDAKTDCIHNRVLNKLESRLEQFIKENKEIDAVVLHDMNKGGISKPLVELLVKIVPERAKWFIATKTWRPESKLRRIEEPDWLSSLSSSPITSQIRLLLIPQSAARRMVEESEISCWMAKHGVPSREALTIMNDLCKQFDQASVVILPDSFSILARDKSSTKGLCIIQTDRRDSETQYGDDESEGVGLSLTSVLFPSIVAQMLSFPEAPLQKILPPALKFTNRRMKEEDDRIKRPEDPKPLLPTQHLKIREMPDWKRACQELAEEPRFNRPVHVPDWNALDEEWKASFQGIGILEDKSNKNAEKRIEPWRAMTELDDYVSCVPSKRSAIRDVLREVTAFKQNPREHKSLMVVAPPGAGKTHFVRALAQAHDFAPLPLNITQMLSKKDLLDFFDLVTTEKLQIKNKNLLVFVDEINALLEGQHVYEAFLAPLEEGIYIRNGRIFRIDPCLWLFAGTEVPREQRDKSAKANDFVSRLSRPPLVLKLEAGEETYLSTERVYLGVCMLRAHYPDVRKVSETVLHAFEFLRPDVEIREIKKFVKHFSGIQNGQVMSRNVPLEMFQKLTHPQDSHPHHWTSWQKEVAKEPRELLVEISGGNPRYMELPEESGAVHQSARRHRVKDLRMTA